MVPFIILGMPRTGSSLLAFSMMTHPKIKIYGELFHKDDEERKRSHTIGTIDDEPIYYKGGNEDAVEFLRKYLWNSYSFSKFQAIGFKLFAERVQCKGTEGLFKRLKEEIPNLHVIIIYRENPLDVFVSIKKAEQSNIWNILTGNEILIEEYKKRVKPIIVDPRTLEEFFNSYKTVYDFYRSFFADIPHLLVNYSELCNNFEKTMNRVFKFLNLTPLTSFNPPLRKQNLQPHKEFLLNYNELKEYFKDTPYHIYFKSSFVFYKFSDRDFRVGDYTFTYVEDKANESHSESLRIRKPFEMCYEMYDLLKQREIKNILEIGLDYGGSAVLYNLLFEPKTYVGIDISDEQDTKEIKILKEYFSERVFLYFNTSQDDEESLREIVKERFSEEGIDLIVDDASHRYDKTLKTFNTLFPYLNPLGYYIIEDWSSYDLSPIAQLLINLHLKYPSSIKELHILNPSLLIIRKGRENLEDLADASYFSK